MIDERAFIERVTAANPEKLVEVFAQPTLEEERALRVYFGDGQFRRLRTEALRRGPRQDMAQKPGRVVVIPSFWASVLAVSDTASNATTTIWLNLLRIASGQVGRLRLDESGSAEADLGLTVSATGVLIDSLGELLLRLSQSWTVRAFPYDWRKQLDLAADKLAAQIRTWFDESDPVHIVAHGTGCLVARLFVKRHPELWRAMWDPENGHAGGRLVLIGGPQHGSFDAPQMLTGLDPRVQKLAHADLKRGLPEILEILHTFPGLYQHLPSPLAVPNAMPLYLAQTYKLPGISQQHLDRAREGYEFLADAIDPERMIIVRGTGHLTPDGFRDCTHPGRLGDYLYTKDGDSQVSARLASLKGVPTYLVEEAGGALVQNRQVLDALFDLLTTGRTDRLPAVQIPIRASKSKRFAAPPPPTLSTELEQRLRNLVRQFETRDDRLLSVEERILAQQLLRDVLGTRESQVDSQPEVPHPLTAPPKIEVGLVHGWIQELTPPAGSEVEEDPIDALAIGYYQGTDPLGNFLALDHAISSSVQGGSAGPLAKSDLVLTQHIRRGILRGDLGQLFLLPDPREPAKRLVVVVGMGIPGMFGEPELTVLAHDLCWSLGKLGKRHLGTVLIGAGEGNIPVEEAVAAWLRGLGLALSAREPDGLRRLTFVEAYPIRLRAIQEAIQSYAHETELTIDFRPLPEPELQTLERLGRKIEAERDRPLFHGSGKTEPDPTSRFPTHLTLGLHGPDDATYTISGLMPGSVIRERALSLDRQLVELANQELAAERDLKRQFERGWFLERLLLPDDLRRVLYSSKHLVLYLDATTARIYWELVARSGVAPRSYEAQESAELPWADHFFSTAQGITRRLQIGLRQRSSAPLRRGVLRVLIVADPADDAPLPGAAEEGVAVADLFEAFDTWASDSQGPVRAEVVRLIGPHEATRTNVLFELLARAYDVLHFAGHYYFNREWPDRSGWVFSGGQIMSARVLNRLDRVPRLVMSNAAESGVIRERSELASVGLAPSCAEAWMLQGVSNVVCAAWPVDDLCARRFALALYGELLGLRLNSDPAHFEDDRPLTMVEAVRHARLAVAALPTGVRAWGAYQHYGDPDFRLLDPLSQSPFRSGPHAPDQPPRLSPRRS